jgi:hypothetical protein
MATAKRKKPWKTSASSGHITNLKQSILETFNIYDTNSSRVTRLGNFCDFGYFFEAHCDFSYHNVAQRNSNFGGCFLLKLICYIFTQISSLRIWFVVGSLRCQMPKRFDDNLLGFQIAL